MRTHITHRAVSALLAVCALFAMYQNSLLGFPDGYRSCADQVLGPTYLGILALSAGLASRYWRASGAPDMGGQEWAWGALALALMLACIFAEPVVRGLYPPNY